MDGAVSADWIDYVGCGGLSADSSRGSTICFFLLSRSFTLAHGRASVPVRVSRMQQELCAQA